MQRTRLRWERYGMVLPGLRVWTFAGEF